MSYPPNKSIIRDWFYIGGVADDETSVRSVEVVFKGLDSLKDKVFGPYKANIDKEKNNGLLKQMNHRMERFWYSMEAMKSLL